MRIVVVLAAVAAVLALLPAAASGRASATVKVDCNAADLQAAVTAANTSGDTLKLAAHCVYSVVTPATAATAFTQITGTVTIIGASSTTIERSPLAATAFRLFDVASGGSLTLRTVMVEHGSSTALGGAIQNAGTLEVKNVDFISNGAGNGGALSNAAGGTATVSNSSFSFNTTTGVGGGGLINFGQLTVKKSDFDSNSAPLNGGGVNVQPGGTTTITGSTFESNTSGSLGGGLSNLGTLTLIGTTVRGNTGSGGGGIATGTSTLVLTRSKVIDNTPDNCLSFAGTIPGCSA